MFVRIEKVDLLNGINMAMRAVGGTSLTQPILKCMLFETVGEGVRLTGNNIDLCIQTALIPANPSVDRVDGAVALEARLFANVVESLPAGEIEISVNENLVTTLKCGKSKFDIAGLNPEIFPSINDFTPTESFTIGSKILRDMIRQTLFCVSQDKNRIALSGENIRVSDGRMEVCAADGYRMALSQADVAYSGEGLEQFA